MICESVAMRARVLARATRSRDVSEQRELARQISHVSCFGALLETNGSRCCFRRSLLSVNSRIGDVRDSPFCIKRSRRTLEQVNSSAPQAKERAYCFSSATGNLPENCDESKNTTPRRTKQSVNERLDPYIYVPGDELPSLRDFSVCFLGTGAGKATLDRNNSATALRTDHATYLFDAGEGVQRQLMKSQVCFSDIKKIFSKYLSRTRRGLL